MRLIDADEFTRIVDSQELMEHLIKVGMKNSQNLSFALAQVIDNRPTAYDIDKVVEELEELKMRYFLTIANTGDEKSDFAYENVGNALDKAIEIVKHGVVSDDVCEWKAGKSNDEWQPNCEPNSTYNVFGVAWFRKCPYCGKKIKVVEV